MLLITRPTEKALRRKIQQTANWTARWTKEAGFTLSPETYELLHACCMNHPVINTPVTINGAVVPRHRTAKILGETFDRHLNFGAHCDKVKAYAKSTLNIMHAINGRHKTANRLLTLNFIAVIFSNIGINTVTRKTT